MGRASKMLRAMNSPENIYARGKASEWLIKVLERNAEMDGNFFDCLKWVTGDLRSTVRRLEIEVRAMTKKPSQSKAYKATKEAVSRPQSRLAYALEELVEEHPALGDLISSIVRDECLKVRKNNGVGETFKAAAKKLKRTFGLSEGGLNLCEFYFINQTFSPVEQYFENQIEVHRYAQRHLLAHMLGMSPTQLRSSFDELSGGGLIDPDNCRYVRLRDYLLPFWDDGRVDAGALFSRPLAGPSLSMSDFCLPEGEISHVQQLMNNDRQAPVHILLYGPPGTGKTSFARSLTKTCGLRAWSVVSRQDDQDDDRRASLTACLNLAAKHPGAVVVVDEAERLLDTGRHYSSKSKDKAWLNDFLEQPGRRIIWITNQVEHIDPAVRRRFAFSLHFPPLGARERGLIWRQILARHRVKRMMNESDIASLVAEYPVEAALINDAVVQAKALYGQDQFRLAVERVLRAQISLQRNGRTLDTKPHAANDFTLDGVCLDGSADTLLKKCRRVDAAMRENSGLRPGSGTMLFYGPPGTGKTALARYLGQELKRGCLVKRASDLLSPYVGVAEQQVAEAFRQAEAEGSVLIIDEADTFLYSRETAQRSWESSLVNEFLTALEECRGFCICTTNRLESLDAAALRRFSHKVAFTYARPEQVRALYSKLLAPLCQGPLPPALEKELLALNFLTPGDFHAVRSQYDFQFEEDGEVSHQVLLEALRCELSLKKHEDDRVIGFCHY